MRDKYGVLDDPYCWPGTSVLRNRLGIRADDELEEAEAQFAAVALESIDIGSPPFDLDYLCRIHRRLFGDVYEWAGQVRTVDISKGRTRFCTASRIVPEARKIISELDALDILGAPWSATLPRLAEHFGELNLVHPFREGNGRALRLFFEHALLTGGKAVDWSRVERGEWIAGCIAAVDCDYGPLQTIFDRCIFPLKA